ncbi:MAG TPA: pitrilysin family protein [Patescibacteria group bacterium]|nr:pitrilysin family protein [Patescibacteria group bacterium]
MKFRKVDKLYQKKIINNGLRLLTIPVKATNVVTVLVLVKAGSRYELDEIAGISHFAEHMFFKGSEKRPSTLAIATAVDAVGGEMNAFTSKEFTGFYIKVSKDYLELALDVLSDLLQAPLFKPKEIEKEKGVIRQEINMYEDTPIKYVDDLIEVALYGDHPLGRLIIGDKKTVSGLNLEKLKKYLYNLYLAKNALVVVSGAFESEAKTQKLVAKYFHLPKTGKPAAFEKIRENQSEPKIICRTQKTEQSHLVLALRGYSARDPKKYILKVISVILGGAMSSRLFLEIREKRGLAYYIKASAPTYLDAGYLMIKAGLENTKVKAAIKIILKELTKLKTKKVAAAELKKAKEYIKGNVNLDIEDSFAQAQFYGLQELLLDKIKTPAEVFKLVDKVTPEDILKTANELFSDYNLNLAIIGPNFKPENFKNILTF